MLNEIKEPVTLTVNQQAFVNALKSALQHCYKDHNNLLSCINFKSNKNCLKIAGVNGNYMIENSLMVENELSEFNVSISYPLIEKIIKNFNTKKKNAELLFVTLCFDLEELTVKGPDGTGFIVKYKEDEKKFPAYERLIPDIKNKKHSITFNKFYLIEVLKSLQANPRTNYITMHFNEVTIDSAEPVIFSNRNPEVKQRCLLMPVYTKD